MKRMEKNIWNNQSLYNNLVYKGNNTNQIKNSNAKQGLKKSSQYSMIFFSTLFIIWKIKNLIYRL